MADENYSSKNDKPLLTQERLKQVLDYEPSTGIFTRKNGEIAGNIQHKGYGRICIDYKSYQSHRLAWLYVYGKFPENCIDHIDGNGLNNAINNLRDVTLAENQQNRKKSPLGSGTGVFGVSEEKRTGKFYSRIIVHGKKIHLGTFDTIELASNAYLKAKRKYHATCTI